MDPTAQLCSHWLHSVATLERRSHCRVAPAVPLLVATGTVDSDQYIYVYKRIKRVQTRKKGR